MNDQPYDTRSTGSILVDLAITTADRPAFANTSTSVVTAPRPKPVRAKLPPRLKTQLTRPERNGFFGRLCAFMGGR